MEEAVADGSYSVYTDTWHDEVAYLRWLSSSVCPYVYEDPDDEEVDDGRQR